MRDTLILWSDRVIRYGVYTLFFLVPLIFTNSNSELFELNKMWLTWEVTIFIACAWFTKMIAQKKIAIQRTPLDIPLLLFLFSQVLSTLFSLDPHTSFWGYYSRFNGGLLSMITYVFLFYAIVSNLTKDHILTLLKVSLASGVIVALWGLPSHFGKDPTCLMFQGSFDVSCWTEAFKPTIRIFSTLGQPAWMAAYLNILLPITAAFFVFLSSRGELLQKKHHKSHAMNVGSKNMLFAACFLLLALLFYLDLIFTNTRAGMIGFWTANSIFWGFLFYKRYLTPKKLFTLALLFNGIFLVLNFLFGTSFAQLDRFTLPALISRQTTTENQPTQPQTAPQTLQPAMLGGTDSGKIRQIVWQGAIDVWKAHPIIGSGAETFAFAYYRHRPAAHNMTSEWDYLYNKAHNEYLNYLATTGIFGLAAYLIFIGLFLYIVAKYLLTEKDFDRNALLILALTAGFISILITNFFAFSVVITNLYLFLIPTFVFLLKPSLLSKKALEFPRGEHSAKQELSVLQWTGITFLTIAGLYFLLILIRFWYADTAYALGSNLSRVQEYQQSYLKLGEAVNLRPSEPTFRDEFAINNAMIAVLLLLQENASASAEIKHQSQALTEQAITMSNDVVTRHPNNISFWKNRVRLFYALAQVDKQYLPYAVDAVEHVHQLAPTDAKVLYNLGALYRENQDPEKSVSALTEAVRLKPDYRDSYYALAIAYNDLAVDTNNQVIRPEMRENAIRQLRFILEKINPEDPEVKQTLASWGVPE